MNRFILDNKYESLLEYMGISVEETLKKAQIPEDIFSRKNPSMTAEEYFRFMEAIDILSNDKSTPVKMGTIDQIETFSPPIFAAYCSKNATTCMKRLARYKKLIGPLIFLVSEDGKEVLLEITSENQELELPEFLVMTEVIFLVNLIRNATKEQIVPKSVTMRHKISEPACNEFLGIEISFGTKNIISFSKQDMEKPFISQNDAMWDYFEPELKRRLSEMDVDDTFSARVRSALIELLPSGQSSVDDVAEKLGCSKRTLQRRLNDEDTTFQKQLNHTRELLAKHYIKNTDMTSDDIAYLLGYQDLNSFLRAFSLWTGTTISEYKKSALRSTKVDVDNSNHINKNGTN
jgi:AraC-type DNA-binding domain-containing proteins